MKMKYTVLAIALILALLPFAASRAQGLGGAAWEAPVTLDYKDADLKDVLYFFGRTTGSEMRVDSCVQGRVTARLRQVPMREAFDMLLADSGYAWSWSGSAITVSCVGKTAGEGISVPASLRETPGKRDFSLTVRIVDETQPGAPKELGTRTFEMAKTPSVLIPQDSAIPIEVRLSAAYTFVKLARFRIDYTAREPLDAEKSKNIVTGYAELGRDPKGSEFRLTTVSLTDGRKIALYVKI